MNCPRQTWLLLPAWLARNLSFLVDKRHPRKARPSETAVTIRKDWGGAGTQKTPLVILNFILPSVAQFPPPPPPLPPPHKNRDPRVVVSGTSKPLMGNKRRRQREARPNCPRTDCADRCQALWHLPTPLGGLEGGTGTLLAGVMSLHIHVKREFSGERDSRGCGGKKGVSLLFQSIFLNV